MKTVKSRCFVNVGLNYLILDMIIDFENLVDSLGWVDEFNRDLMNRQAVQTVLNFAEFLNLRLG